MFDLERCMGSTGVGIGYGNLQSNRPAALTLPELLGCQAESRPHNIALETADTSYTYRQMEALAWEIGGHLVKIGASQGSRVMVIAESHPHSVIAMFGITTAACVFVPVAPETAPNRITYLALDCQPCAIVADGPSISQLDDTLLEIGIPVLALSAPTSRTKCKPKHLHLDNASSDLERSDRQVHADAPAAILYTSGTEGKPLGVVCPHRSVIFACHAINSVLNYRQDDRVLGGLPLSFDYGLYQAFLCCEAGATLVLDKRSASILTIPTLLSQYRITGWPGVPSIYAYLLESRLLERTPLHFLRFITSTGDTFASSQIDRLQNLLPNVAVYSMYGLTECKRVSILRPEELSHHRGSVGRPIPGTSVSVLTASGAETTVGLGELIIRGDHVMAGYWNAPTATARRFVRDEGSSSYALHSGDIVRIDESGYLHFIGRDELLIKHRGFRVSAAEIESVLMDVEDVAEAVVVGVPHHLDGESIWAYVYSPSPHKPSEDAIKLKCRDQLGQRFVPSRVLFRTQPLPRTVNRKFDRLALRDEAKSHT